MKDERKPILVYIVGKGHSGSTMLELLLNRSANIAAMGEIDMLALQVYRDEETRWVGRCSCGERPQDCSYWGTVIREINSQYGVDFVRKPFKWPISDVGIEEEYGVRRPLAWSWYRFHRLVRTVAYRGSGQVVGPFGRQYRQWIANRDYVATQYAKVRGVEAVVDASKDPLQMRDIVAYSQLPVRILFLTRDVRGLAWSAVRRRRNTAVREARRWTKLNAHILSLLAGIDPNIWLHIPYESVCADSEVALNRIHRFIGVERRALSPLEERSRRHTVAGNRTRLRDLTDIREDQSWRENLSKADIDAIRAVAGDLAARLGYEI